LDLLRKLNCTQEAINSLLERVEDGEFTTEDVADTIEALNGTIEQNCDDIATVILSQEGEILYLHSEINRLQCRVENMTTNYKRLMNGLQSYLKSKGVKKVHTFNHDFTVCKNGGKQPIEVTADVYDIPQEYCIFIPKPNTDVIRKALESGQELEFAHLKERGEHLRIK
jgi:hypothetical protein